METTNAAPATREEIAAIVEEAELPALLATLAYLSGDTRLIAADLRPPVREPSSAFVPQGGMGEESQARARALCTDVLVDLQARDFPVPTEVSGELLRDVMEFITGPVDEDHLDFLRHELAIPDDLGMPSWHLSETGREFSVAVIGAGLSGIAAAYRLQQAGVDFVVLEKNPDVGGTWWENRYPGCRLDTNNFAYSFSFAQRGDWPEQFSERDSIWSYLSRVADETGIREHIRFGTEAVLAEYDDDTGTWRVESVGPDGEHDSRVVNAVITAVGQLNRPKLPDIAGIETFEGRSFHTAQWPDDIDLAGKTVAVVGTGASAYQVVPSIVDQVGTLRVFQRNAPWMLPTPNYHQRIEGGLRWLFDHVPEYHRWYRFWQFWVAAEGRLPFIEVDPEWTGEGTVSQLNDQLRRELTEHVLGQFRDRPDLAEKVVPTYPPGAKRLLRDNGVWAAALKSPNAELVTTGIERITPTGIRTVDGTEHPCDVIVYATGFRAEDFLVPMTVRGIAGLDLHKAWNEDARAYLGVAVPQFPNLFMVFGPNSGVAVNGSVIFMAECAVEYIIETLGVLIRTGKKSIEIKEEPFLEYNAAVDEANALKAWGVAGVNNWYKNKFGRVTANWPYSLVEYWRRTRRPIVENYETR